MTQSHIPIVDIAPFREGDPAGSRQAVKRIGRACEEIGFFTIVGHGVSADLIDRLYHTSRAFFDMPLKKKRLVGPTGDELDCMCTTPISQSAGTTRISVH